MEQEFSEFRESNKINTTSMHSSDRGCVYPRMHWAGGLCLGGVCPGVGVSGWGVSAQGVGMSAWGMSAQGVGVSAQGGVCLEWCGRHPRDLRQTHTPCEENDWQTGVKTLPCHNFIAGGKYFIFLVCSSSLFNFGWGSNCPYFGLSHAFKVRSSWGKMFLFSRHNLRCYAYQSCKIASEL